MRAPAGSRVGGGTVLKITESFRFKGKPVRCREHGSGLVNRTYCVFCDSGAKYILQRVNREAFQDPPALMNNIDKIIRYLKPRVRSPRETLSLVATVDEGIYARDEAGEFWRAYDYIADSICLERADGPAVFYESGLAYGRFLEMLSSFPLRELTETIPRFHDTVFRYERFKDTVGRDPLGRLREVREEIDFALSREPFAALFMELLRRGALPLRVTHNDTKLNNVLFDRRTRRALCVIDLDTVMPGLIMNDFGDAIRFGANSAAEDETDLSLVELDLELFRAFTGGFIESCGGQMTELERELLPAGVKMMTLECGVRFLTDYLEGDTYFQTEYPEHNRDRCRAQFALFRDLEKKEAEMVRIVRGKGT